MTLGSKIEGKRIALRPATVADAEFMLELRLDPELNKHLNPTSPSVSAQVEWIKKLQDRPGDYCFIIEKPGGTAIGTVSLYEIDDTRKSFNWGRWLLSKKAPMYAAIESTILIYHLAFDIMKLEEALSDVRVANKNVINFHLSYGAKIYNSDETDHYYSYKREQFPELLKKFKGFHNLDVG